MKQLLKVLAIVFGVIAIISFMGFLFTRMEIMVLQLIGALSLFIASVLRIILSRIKDADEQPDNKNRE